MADLPHVRPSAPEAPTQPAGTVRAFDALDVVGVLVQLFAYVSLAIWGFTAWPFFWNIVIGIAAPVVALLLWALFVSPRAVIRVHPFVRALVELLVYASATLAWWSADQPWIGVGFAVVAVAVGLVTGRRRLG